MPLKTNKIAVAFKVIKTVRNWPLFFLDYMGLIKKNPITYTLWNGIKYEINTRPPERSTIREVWIAKEYNPKGFEINKSDIVLDIGAHKGVFSIFASYFAKKGRIYSFEPFKENFEGLKRNIKLNKMKNIIVINKAVSNKTGTKDLILSDSSTKHSFYFNKDNKTKKVKVKTISLKDFVKQNKINNINFLKIDAEGAEYNILFSCPNEIFKLIEKISMECHNLNKKYNVFSLRNFLKNKGFDVEIIKTGSYKGMGFYTLYAKQD